MRHLQSTSMQNTWLSWKRIWMFQRTWWITSVNCYLFMVLIKVFTVSLLGMIRFVVLLLLSYFLIIYMRFCQRYVLKFFIIQNYVLLTELWILNQKFFCKNIILNLSIFFFFLQNKTRLLWLSSKSFFHVIGGSRECSIYREVKILSTNQLYLVVHLI